MASALSTKHTFSTTGERYPPYHHTVANDTGYTSTAYPGQRCDCCPYNYHIDLDFLHYLDNLTDPTQIKRDIRRTEQASPFRSVKTQSRDLPVRSNNGYESLTKSSRKINSSNSSVKKQILNEIRTDSNYNQFSVTEPELPRCQQPVHLEIVLLPEVRAASVVSSVKKSELVELNYDQRYRSETDLFVNDGYNNPFSTNMERRTNGSIKQLCKTSRDVWNRLERRSESIKEKQLYTSSNKTTSAPRINRRHTDVSNETIRDIISTTERRNKEINIFETNDGTRIIKDSPTITKNKPNIFVSVSSSRFSESCPKPEAQISYSSGPDLLQRVNELEEEVKSMARLQFELTNLREENRRLYRLIEERSCSSSTLGTTVDLGVKNFLEPRSAQNVPTCDKSSQTFISSADMIFIEHESYGDPIRKSEFDNEWKKELNEIDHEPVKTDAEMFALPPLSPVHAASFMQEADTEQLPKEHKALISEALVADLDCRFSTNRKPCSSVDIDKKLRSPDEFKFNEQFETVQDRESKDFTNFEKKSSIYEAESNILETFAYNFVQEIITSACKQIKDEDGVYALNPNRLLTNTGPELENSCSEDLKKIESPNGIDIDDKLLTATCAISNMKALKIAHGGNSLVTATKLSEKMEMISTQEIQNPHSELRHYHNESVEDRDNCIAEEKSNREDEPISNEKSERKHNSNALHEPMDLIDLTFVHHDMFNRKEGVNMTENQESLKTITDTPLNNSDSKLHLRSNTASTESIQIESISVEHLPVNTSLENNSFSAEASTGSIIDGAEDDVTSDEFSLPDVQSLISDTGETTQVQDCKAVVALREHVDKDKSVEIEVVFDVQDFEPSMSTSESDATSENLESTNESEDTVIEKELVSSKMKSGEEHEKGFTTSSGKMQSGTGKASSETKGDILNSRRADMEKDMDVTLQELQTCSKSETVRRQISSLSGGAAESPGSTSDETDICKEVVVISEGQYHSSGTESDSVLTKDGGRDHAVNSAANVSIDETRNRIIGSESRQENVVACNEADIKSPPNPDATETAATETDAVVNISSAPLSTITQGLADTSQTVEVDKVSNDSATDEPDMRAITDETGEGSIAGGASDGSMASEIADGSMASVLGDGSVTSEPGDGAVASDLCDDSLASLLGDGSMAGEPGDGSIASDRGECSMTSVLGDGSATSELDAGSPSELGDVFLPGEPCDDSAADKSQDRSVSGEPNDGPVADEEKEVRSSNSTAVATDRHEAAASFEGENDSAEESSDMLDSLVSDKVYEISEELMAACSVYCQWMKDVVTVSPTDLGLARELIQRHWFYVAGRKNSSSQEIQRFLTALSQFGDPLLSAVVNMQDIDGNTALHYAVSQGNFETIAALLEVGMCDAGIENLAGYSALLLVALLTIDGEEEKLLVHKLFSAGNVNATSSSSGQTALMLAASQGGLETVRLLLDCGADVNTQDEDGSTALMCASEHGHSDIISALLDVPGCDSTLTDMDGSTAFTIAMEEGHQEIGAVLYAHMSSLASQVKNDDDDV